MSKDNKKRSGLLGPLGREWVETRPVGGRIPKDNFDEWETFKSRCAIAGLQLSPDGLLDMLVTYNKLNSVIFRIANSYGLRPIHFKDKIMDMVLEVLNKVDEKKVDESIQTVIENIRQQMEEEMRVKVQ